MIPRYREKKIEIIWSQKQKYSRWFHIEQVLLEALREERYFKYSENIERIKIDKKFIKEIEKEEQKTQHDVAAFVNVISQKLPYPLSLFVHYGLTSSDIVDTANAIAFRLSFHVLLQEIKKLKEALLQKAEKTKEMKCLGRTHGQAAEIMTYGVRFMRHLNELKRIEKKIKQFKNDELKGKLSGSVGCHHHLPEDIEKKVLRKLNLKSEIVDGSQIINRSYYYEITFLLSQLGNTIEKIAMMIRIGSQTGIEELKESFKTGEQIGSSSMPHKKNPIKSEQICGMNRMLRSYLNVMGENDVMLWSERDISHSCNERIIFEDQFHIASHMVKKMTQIINELYINEQKIRDNIEKTKEIESQLQLHKKIGESYQKNEKKNRKELYYEIVKEM